MSGFLLDTNVVSELDQAPLARLGPGKALVLLGWKHHHSRSTVLGHALRAAFPCQTEHFAKTRLRFLQLPILLDRMALSI